LIVARILIAGIGNIFLGDDAFGCEVARQLYQRPWPESVRIVDFGIRGLDLTYALLENYDLVIFIDALRRGNAPGTLYTFEPDLEELDALDNSATMVETHDMNPLRVLSIARRMGATFGAIRLIGCEPETFGPEEGFMGLSAPVVASIAPATKMVESLVKQFSELTVTQH
jgi:hydrogenase maturation protease